MERLPSRPPAARTWRASQMETSLLGRDPRRHRSIQHQRIHPCQALCPGCETQRAREAAWAHVWPRMEEVRSPLASSRCPASGCNRALPGWIPCLHRPRALGISHALHVMCLASVGKEGADLQHGSVVTQSNIDLMEPSMAFDELVQRGVPLDPGRWRTTSQVPSQPVRVRWSHFSLLHPCSRSLGGPRARARTNTSTMERRRFAPSSTETFERLDEPSVGRV